KTSTGWVRPQGGPVRPDEPALVRRSATADRPCGPTTGTQFWLGAPHNGLTGAAKHQSHSASGFVLAHSRLAVACVATVDGFGRAGIIACGLSFRLAPIDAAPARRERAPFHAGQDGHGVFGQRRGKANFLIAVLDPG